MESAAAAGGGGAEPPEKSASAAWINRMSIMGTVLLRVLLRSPKLAKHRVHAQGRLTAVPTDRGSGRLARCPRQGYNPC